MDVAAVQMHKIDREWCEGMIYDLDLLAASCGRYRQASRVVVHRCHRARTPNAGGPIASSPWVRYPEPRGSHSARTPDAGERETMNQPAQPEAKSAFLTGAAGLMPQAVCLPLTPFADGARRPIEPFPIGDF